MSKIQSAQGFLAVSEKPPLENAFPIMVFKAQHFFSDIPSSPDALDRTRGDFADAVTRFAARCDDVQEFESAMQEELGDNCHLIGEGSTRRVYGTPLGVVVKVQRDVPLLDPLPDAEMERRGGFGYIMHLTWRRRASNLAEVLFAKDYPRLAPKLYGFTASFGLCRSNPSVIVAETCRPLELYRPGEQEGVKAEDLGISEAGYLWVFDPRFCSVERPPEMRTADDVLCHAEPMIWLGNIGVSVAGKYVFIDRSDYGAVKDVVDEFRFCPHAGWSLTTSASDFREQTTKWSDDLMDSYRSAVKGG